MSFVGVYFIFGANLAHRTADGAERNENAEIIGAGCLNDLHTPGDIIWPVTFQRYHLISAYSAFQSCPN
jgi:hypothetical protein